MNDIGPRSSAYAGDTDYDALHGYVTAQRTVRGVTRDGWVVQHTVTVINLGRAAPVTARDPDAAIAEVHPGLRSTRMHGKTADLMAAVSDLLRRKPHTALELARALRVSPFRVKALVRYHAEEFEVVSRGVQGCVYTLAGD